ncbi:MAG: hypothetical protein P1U39_06690 [Legionellaceae bacterium]|nr:hypothetical protein [Legionellaceae bacterium]
MSKFSSDYIKHRCTYDGTFFSRATLIGSSMAFSSVTAGIGALLFPATAAAAGGISAVIGASALGGGMFHGLPTQLNRFMVDEIQNNTELNFCHKLTFCGIVLLAAATGAFMIDIAILPVVTCALMGLALTALVDTAVSFISDNLESTSTSDADLLPTL